MQKKKGHKLFVVRKYVMAKNVKEAIRKESTQLPDDVFVDDLWKQGNAERLGDAIGFTHTHEEERED